MKNLDINNIPLHPQLLAGLYADALIAPPNAAPKAPVVETATVQKPPPKTDDNWPHTGQNKKNLLVVVQNDDGAAMPDTQKNLLGRILAACRLTFEDVAIINHFYYKEYNHNEILQHFNTKTILLFGITTQKFGLPVAIPNHQVQQFNNTIMLQTLPLDQLETNDAERKNFWTALRTIFNV